MAIKLVSQLVLFIIFGLFDTLPGLSAIQGPFSLTGLWVTKDGAQLTVKADGHFELQGTVFGKKYNIRGVVKSRKLSAKELAAMGVTPDDVLNHTMCGFVEFDYNELKIRAYSSVQGRDRVIIECEPQDARGDFPPTLFLNRKRNP